MDSSAPKILLMAPAAITQLTEFADMFEGAQKKSAELSAHYRALSKQYACSFLNCGDIIACSNIDGIHLEVSAHLALGQAVADQVQLILSEAG